MAERLERQTEDPEVPCSNPDATVTLQGHWSEKPVWSENRPSVYHWAYSTQWLADWSQQTAQAVKRSSLELLPSHLVGAPQNYIVTNI